MLEAKHDLESGLVFGDMSGRQGTPAPVGIEAPGPAPVATAAPMAPPAPTAPIPLSDPIDTPAEVTAALASLADLRDRGAITSGEYEVKKRELLGRL